MMTHSVDSVLSELFNSSHNMSWMTSKPEPLGSDSSLY